MKKLLLLCAAFAAALGLNAQLAINWIADKYEFGPEQFEAEGSISWDSVKQAFVCNGTGPGKIKLKFDGQTLDFSKVINIEVKGHWIVGDDTDTFHMYASTDPLSDLVIEDEDNGRINGWYSSRYTVDYVNYNSKSSKIKAFYYNANANVAGDIYIEKVVLTKQHEFDEFELCWDKFKEWSNWGENASIVNETPDIIDNRGMTLKEGGVIVGTNGVEGKFYADLTKYSGIEATGTPGLSLRMLFNRPSMEGGGAAVTECKPVFDQDGKFTFLFSEVKTKEGENSYPYIHLNSIKTNGKEGDEYSVTSLRLIDPLAGAKEGLTAKINEAELYDAFAKDKDNFATLQTAINSAKEELEKNDATLESLQGSLSQLTAAVDGLNLEEGYENLTADMFMRYENVKKPGDVNNPGVGKGTGCAYDIFKATGMPYGDGGVNVNNWADLSDYDKLIITTVGATEPRIMMNREFDSDEDGNLKYNEKNEVILGSDAANQADSKMLEMAPGNGKWSTAAYLTVADNEYKEEGKVYTVNLKKIKEGEGDIKGYGFAHLNAIKKNGWGADIFVTGMYLYQSTNALELPLEDLTNEIAKAEACDNFLKTEASWKALQTAIDEGKAKLAETKPTVESVEAATKKIADAIAALALQPGYEELTKGMFKHYNSVNNPGEGEAAGCDYNLGMETGSPYGDCSNVGYLNWADLTAYDKLVLKVTSGSPRFCLNRIADGGQQGNTMAESKMVDIEAWKDNWSIQRYLTSKGEVYTVDLAKIIDDYGFARLHAIKFSGVVAGMYLYKDPTPNKQFNLTFNIDNPEHVVISVNGGQVTGLNAGSNEEVVENRAKLSIAPAAGFILKTVTADGENVELNDGLLSKTITKAINFTITTADADPLAQFKKELRATIEKANLYDSICKTEVSFKALTDAIAAGEIDLTAKDATKESLTAANTKINNAINGLTLQKDYSYLTREMFKEYASLEEPGDGIATECDSVLFETSRKLYGDANDNFLKYADLSNYDQLIIATTGEETRPRIVMNRLKADGEEAATLEESKKIEINPYGNKSWSTDKYQTIEGNKYIIDLNEIKKDFGFAHLHSIQVNDWGTGLMPTGMYLYKDPFVAVTSVALNVEKVEKLVKGASVQLTATVLPDNATNREVTWRSSNEEVATVDQEGNVTAVSPGEVTITATAGEKSATCQITVIIPVTGVVINLDEKEVVIVEGAEFTVGCTVVPTDATDKTVKWSSSNEEVATVDSDGKVTAIAAGEAVITATAGDKSDTCKFIVKKAVKGVTINKTSAELTIDDTLQLTATIDPADAIVSTVTWSSSNEKVATVDQTGKVTAVDGGTAVITAAAGEKSAECTVTVVVPVTGLEVKDAEEKTLESGATIALYTGDSYDLTAVVLPANATDQQVVWTSSNEEVAEVNSKGLIETHKAGEAKITAKIAEFTFEAKVVVSDPLVAVTGVALDKTKAEMLSGSTLQLKATIAPENATSQEVVWTSSDNTIATVDKKGLVTAIKAGTVTITATANKINATCEITITDPYYAVTGISLDVEKIEKLIEGETVKLTATVLPENATDTKVTWSSSDEEVATVDQDGNVKAVAPGNVTITATAGEEKSATCQISVVAKPIAVQGIVLSEEEVVMVEGAEFELGYTIVPSNATDKTVTWTSSNEKIATVDANGKVKAIAAGEAVITAKAGEKSDECKFIVKKAVAGVALDKTVAEMTVGDTLQLTATIDPADAIETTVKWSSSDKAVATVDANGMVKAIAAGEVTITAEAGEKSATCKITVEPAVVEVEKITLDKTEAKMIEGETLTLVATVVPEDATDPTITWSSSNEKVATVDANGMVKAIAAGEVTITAEAGEKSATCKITVEPAVAEVEKITLDKTEATMLIGETLTLKATVTPEDATDATVTWSSSDESIATVDEDGVVTAFDFGEVTITAKAGEITAECKVKVDKSSGIELIGFDAEAPIMVFDLRGVYVSDKVENLVPGFYIIRQGNKVKKIHIR